MVFGIVLMIAIPLALIVAVIGVFVHNIILFDSISIGIIAGACAKNFLPIHPAFAFLIGLGTFLVLLWLQQTKVGFWIISIIMSLIWGFIFSIIAYFITSDEIWVYVVWGVGFFVVIGLHLSARDTYY